MTPDPSFGLEINGRAVRRELPLELVCEPAAPLDSAPVLVTPLSQPPPRDLGTEVVDSPFTLLSV